MGNAAADMLDCAADPLGRPEDFLRPRELGDGELEDADDPLSQLTDAELDALELLEALYAASQASGAGAGGGQAEGGGEGGGAGGQRDVEGESKDGSGKDLKELLAGQEVVSRLRARAQRRKRRRLAQESEGDHLYGHLLQAATPMRSSALWPLQRAFYDGYSMRAWRESRCVGEGGGGGGGELMRRDKTR